MSVFFGNWLYNRFSSSALYPYVQLARWDLPTGWCLLMWPCLWSTILAAHLLQKTQTLSFSVVFWYILLYILGAIAMRGAGCTWNDLVDQEIDAQVGRTCTRPLPSGKCSRFQAYVFIMLQLFVGFIVLIQFNYFTICLGLAFLIIPILYPFAKRFTNCPQVVLGLCFSGGSLIGWSSLQNSLSLSVFSLYIATICWVIGYDTIYAFQDKKDDELIGVGSTAMLFAYRAKPWIFALYGIFVACFMFSLYLVQVNFFGWIGLLIVSFMLVKQVAVLDISLPEKCLVAFKNNNIIGMVMFISLVMSLLSSSFLRI
ncbi:4-hydroxybenzoate octaprenyltransferase [Candidatus Liberibacter sp.]|uniref:4-hydroxybenzoate octaprenyltransferase n=1 Tax=Candidatus Liberibacter sp. TaxID=34022 RepID=UPI0015F76D90|nr:4-hydroxybenzoate octaprenyltransferase [Candidatus Liberibacter sp.]MBA5724431.1 4-hydroxybenzoate octaprenyltransferase [Candidatus Liberibacter sp.]